MSSLNKIQARQIHRLLAPILTGPLLLTVLTGSLYQVSVLNGNFDFYWLIEIHKGHFGPLKLEHFYPFLNGLGLWTMAISGLSLWLQGHKLRKKKQ
ncbi:MAG: PepSY domain-containing protein [Cyanobacteriota bacterium]